MNLTAPAMSSMTECGTLPLNLLDGKINHLDSHRKGTTRMAQIYVAGPLFAQHERLFLEEMVRTLALHTGLDPLADFFLPHRDGGELGRGPTREEIFRLDIEQVDKAEMVVALLDGQDSDSGTCVEIGYAFARGKPVFGLLTDFRAICTADPEPHRPNLMVWGACAYGRRLFHTLEDLVTAFSIQLMCGRTEEKK